MVFSWSISLNAVSIALKAEWGEGYQWRMRLTKEHPPVTGAVDHVVYVLEG